MRIAFRSALSLAVVACGSAVLQAHPGHAHEVVPAESSWHYVLQPEHAMVTGLGVALLVGLVSLFWMRAQVRRSQRQLQPLRVRR